ncbi:DMT family transporter [Reyranella sp.]|jgi:drug/metabolite transporter (DMT)-like permease|uniref:DMT family transporter n=1 Tax=Reyranella sp. TaxID=1929291 RepID=UPI00121CADE2|nr:DMT family transporter [Reyranella sp.]TAJ83229.1 MAG: DMT family transporter [Reyranella sp.]
MKSDVPPPVDRTLRAILSIIFSVLCFSVLNAISKTLSQTFPVVEVIWGRYIFAFIFMLVLFLPQSGMNLFRWHNVPSQIIRGLLLFFSSFLYFHGIVYLPLATAASISLTSPLVVTALSSKFLGEPVGPRRWAACAVGFIGALIVVRPGHAHFEWHSLLIVASTLCSSLYQLFSRRYGQTERPDASATMATIVGTVVAMPLLPFEWVTPTLGWHWALFVGMGVMAGVGHYFLTIAYSQAPAAVVAPFNYMQLLGAALLGYLVFQDVPDFWTWIGAGVIVCSGLYLGHVERQRIKSALKP